MEKKKKKKNMEKKEEKNHALLKVVSLSKREDKLAPVRAV